MNLKKSQNRHSRMLMGLAMGLLAVIAFSGPALAAKDKPNILVIFGDDIEANAKGGAIVDMKHDWKRVFPFESRSTGPRAMEPVK